MLEDVKFSVVLCQPARAGKACFPACVLGPFMASGKHLLGEYYTTDLEAVSETCACAREPSN